MPTPYSIVGFLVASSLWLLAGLWNGPCPEIGQPVRDENPMALRGSAYGTLVARLMKDSMHNYWHAGHAHRHAAKLGSAGMAPNSAHDHALHSHDQKTSECVAPTSQKRSWMEQKIDWLAELEEERMTPTSKIRISNAHRRYLDASADWHLRVAYRLDPGDAALYEILHYTVMGRAIRPELAQSAAEKLAEETIAHALSKQGGMSAALTGAGAAINVLNNDMVSESGVGREVVRRHWEMLSTCLNRYRERKAQAVADGWWDRVPKVRRGELSAYAVLVEKLSSTIERKLLANGMFKADGEKGL